MDGNTNSSRTPGVRSLEPRAGAIALCGRGFLGLITSQRPVSVTYRDGTEAPTWGGFHLQHQQLSSAAGVVYRTVEVGDSWSSRNPVVLGYLEDLLKHLDFYAQNYKQQGHCPTSAQQQPPAGNATG